MAAAARLCVSVSLCLYPSLPLRPSSHTSGRVVTVHVTCTASCHTLERDGRRPPLERAGHSHVCLALGAAASRLPHCLPLAPAKESLCCRTWARLSKHNFGVSEATKDFATKDFASPENGFCPSRGLSHPTHSTEGVPKPGWLAIN